MRKRIGIPPSARRLVTSLRDLGYSFPTAIADLVDNSVSAGARRVDIEVAFNGLGSHVLVADDGRGMTEAELDEALRFGAHRVYGDGDLGRFGLGLKTASISQGRRLTVVTRRAAKYRRLYSRVLDLGHITQADRWEVLEGLGTRSFDLGAERLDGHPGTVVVIDHLDRVLPEKRPEGGWARRRFQTLERRTADYLGMVFHRMLERADGSRLSLTVNGRDVEPWNPFAPDEGSLALPERELEVELDGSASRIRFQGFVLPPRGRFSSQEAFERMAGPGRWNRQQGLYFYRADRMIQSGGWCGLRASDEHTKLARASIDFGTTLDEFFKINVAKMRVALPSQVKTSLDRSIRELCHRAQVSYRGGKQRLRKSSGSRGNGKLEGGRELAMALSMAASEVGESSALEKISARLRETDPSLARTLGW